MHCTGRWSPGATAQRHNLTPGTRAVWTQRFSRCSHLEQGLQVPQVQIVVSAQIAPFLLRWTKGAAGGVKQCVAIGTHSGHSVSERSLVHTCCRALSGSVWRTGGAAARPTNRSQAAVVTSRSGAVWTGGCLLQRRGGAKEGRRKGGEAQRRGGAKEGRRKGGEGSGELALKGRPLSSGCGGGQTGSARPARARRRGPRR